MSKYLKLFETTSQYEAYIKGSDVVLPNVSVAEDDLTKVYYNPWVAKVIATVNVTSTSDPTYILNDSGNISAVEIDGVEQPSVENEYTFSTTGEHTVKYTLIEPTSIGESAFEGCNSLTSMTIPNSVTSIGDNAFQECTGLTSITIPDSVTSIGDYAFNGCESLTSMTILDSVTTIGEGAFNGCTGLTSIVVDSANTVYDSRNNCNAIINTSANELIAGCKNTVIPNTVTSIGNYAFSNCSGLTSITIPDSVTSIGQEAFSSCTGLTSVTIGNGVTSIGSSAFSYCESLTNITIPNSVTNIGNNAFGSCTGLTSIICNATTAPTIRSNTFTGVKTGGTLTVPSGSTGYNVWMGTGNYYLGKYNWRKVKQ